MIATVMARCRVCGDALDHPAEYVGGVCLPCLLGSVPMSRGTTICSECENEHYWNCTCLDADGEPGFASYLTGANGSNR